jgi:hypothetical protein
VWRANVFRLVEARDDLVVLWAPAGVERWLPVDAAGSEIRIPQAEWTLTTRPTGEETLTLARDGSRHSLWLMWDEQRRFSHWYVNFEEPLGRTPFGFDYHDWKLDLVVQADAIARAADAVPLPTTGRAHDLKTQSASSYTMRWKDEDELEEAASRGILDADEVWAEARRVIADPPWPTGWEDWRPDPTWPAPRFPDGSLVV